MAEGIGVGCLACAATVGAGFLGMWHGPARLATGELGLVAVAALVLYLAVLGAGRILIALLAVLGACLAFTAPDIAAGIVLDQRGRVESAVVASVQDVTGRAGRHLCSVTGTVAIGDVRVWRGCPASVAPGDTVPVVYDPHGLAPARGIAAAGALRRGELRLAGLAAGFVAVSAVAVVRSFRMSPQPSVAPALSAGLNARHSGTSGSSR
ncbi:hypothetical protein [Streptomyces sp. NPDC049813]|uniref:hypothetical protein n=1 Tax=Streptomyces sp. NPDC049813 TaxID=3365597 RepID=UPI0037AC4317